MAARRLLGGEGGAAPRPLLPRPASGGARPGLERQPRGRSESLSPGRPGAWAPRAESSGPQAGDALRGLREAFPRDEDAAGQPESEARSERSGAARPESSPRARRLSLPPPREWKLETPAGARELTEGVSSAPEVELLPGGGVGVGPGQPFQGCSSVLGLRISS